MDRCIRMGQILSFDWKWKGQPGSGDMLSEFMNLLSLLSNYHFDSREDQWAWNINGATEFSVSMVKKELMKEDNNSSGSGFEWNLWAPIKVNLFVWRLLLDRISTAYNLYKRGIIHQMVDCKLCGDSPETTDHMVTSCYIASVVWQRVGAWCKLPPIFLFSTKDVMEIHTQAGGTDQRKKTINVILMVSLWSIWKARNKAIFEDEQVEPGKITGEMKSLSILWVKYRSKICNLDWIRWLNFDL
ncbi:putative reverse transcriptase zinc-binding domain-containing protein [Helianthus annuus]|uniref:Reverse transcriptase zinc-binding domain-containing protein n=2 Tax=Helianthus annuus TaxID=4232 RepID=A0A9K3NQ49_HELAN|nr:putative reverse transcriptase zinc-binding domain-containing protein [Helianthus annuus]KAJ0920500.1 putative reverse transcriptase zinc-binding domain-containing protein [Helianthus annuus]KAJ0924123.1 putative reverse transcriptase zinc-binding domain-containing protein [Helianthus annuus]